MKNRIFVATLIIGFTLTNVLQAQINLIHSFTGTPNDGANPHGSLLLDGTTLYGMTYSGGSSDFGTIFKVETYGTGFSILHNFGSNPDGAWPHGSLILDGTTLYGMTVSGGNAPGVSAGTIFKIETDGTGHTIMHSFNGATGSEPWGSLLLDWTTLYGMTYHGGPSARGDIFKIRTDGTSFTKLFDGSPGVFNWPFGSLILDVDGTTLYGMTQGSGIFEIQTDGTGHLNLHTFASGTTDGLHPYGSLIQDGTTLYGMTAEGGLGYGVIFEMETDQTGFSLLHTFSDNPDGATPYGDLLQDGSTLYGMTSRGGTSDLGTIFFLDTDGSNYTVGHSFTGGAADGARPYLGSLIKDGTTLYGMTAEGGSSNLGTVFKIEEYALPVELTEFTARVTLNGVELYWITESEIENLGFIIERKTESTDWIEIANYKTDDNLLGQGTISSATDYSYTDHLVEAGSTYEYRLSDVGYSGVVTYHATREITVETKPLAKLEKFTVLPAYPNPFNPNTTIRYGLETDNQVSIQIYDITGQLISTLLDDNQSKGWHSITWDGTNSHGEQVPAGLYISRIKSNNEVITSKLMLLK